jgi:hypothetical protein
MVWQEPLVEISELTLQGVLLTDRPWWDLTKYTGQERALLAVITFLLLLFGPRIFVLLLAFLERAIVASGLVIETALINIFIATFKWVGLA